MRKLKSAIKKVLPKPIVEIHNRIKWLRPIEKRTCPLCGYYGWFGPMGIRPRIDAMCPNCESLERHRLFYLGCERNQIIENGRFLDPVIHFAPEKVLERYIRPRCNDYKTADLFAPADLKLNLESIDLEDESVGTVIANHVFEHVDDKKAAGEVHRILKPGGILIASVPIVEGWDDTYEDPSVTSKRDRCGQDSWRSEELDDAIQVLGGSATLVPLDLMDSEGIDRLGGAIYERWGKLDILLGNAGLLGATTPITHADPKKDWDKVIGVNLTANWRLTRSFDPLLRQSDAGRALFMTSGAPINANHFGVSIRYQKPDWKPW